MTLSPRAIEAAIEEYRGGGSCCSEDSMRAAIESALAVDGLCLVPKEPSIAMLNAGDEAFDQSEDKRERETVGELIPWSHSADVYRAMIAAASDGKERK